MRYGDNAAPTDFSFHRCMQTDLEMLKLVENVDAEGFVQFLVKEQDRRHVLGFSAIYLLLRLIEADKGEVLRYDREDRGSIQLHDHPTPALRFFD